MTAAVRKIKDAASFNNITALIWILAGLLYVSSGDIVLGMLNICIGCMFIAMSGKKTEEKKCKRCGDSKRIYVIDRVVQGQDYGPETEGHYEKCPDCA